MGALALLATGAGGCLTVAGLGGGGGCAWGGSGGAACSAAGSTISAAGVRLSFRGGAVLKRKARLIPASISCPIGTGIGASGCWWASHPWTTSAPLSLQRPRMSSSSPWKTWGSGFSLSTCSCCNGRTNSGFSEFRLFEWLPQEQLGLKLGLQRSSILLPFL